MPKVYHCFNCSLQHERRVGKKCHIKDHGESLSTDVEVAAPPSSDIRLSEQILLQLQQLGEKMDSMDKHWNRTTHRQVGVLLIPLLKMLIVR